MTTGKRNQSCSSPIGSPSSDSNSSNKDVDRFLPIANVSRIMKKSLPPNAKISKEAKETVQECVSEFISFITGEASDKCQREKRKTINGDDLMWAMTTLGFENYVTPLKVYLNKYRETEGDANQKINPVAAPRQEDQQYSSELLNNINVVNGASVPAMAAATEHHLQGYGSGFFSVGAQDSHPQNYGDGGIRGIGYGENLMATGTTAQFHRLDWL